MSRVDQALTIAEGGTTASDATTTWTDLASALQQYRPESPEARPVEPPAPPHPAERPRAPRKPSGAPHRAEVDARIRSGDSDLDARLVTGTSSAVSLEQYRRLAAVLHEEQIENDVRTVMITSALPGEGKTLTVVNLALTLSESYARRVLVIDADLRWPSVHTALGIPNDRGLSEALRDDTADLPFTQVSTGLTVMTAGKPGPAPLAGLTSPRMEEVLKECALQFDWVLLDTSPVGVLPDAQVLARLAGGVILVIGAGSTPAEAVERTVAELGGPEAIIGTVLNRVEEHRIPDAGYYGQYGSSPSRR